MAKGYGVTPWGEYFLDAVKKFYSYEPRIGRGRRYANTGRIVKLKVEKNKVLARVRGNYGYDYKVSLQFSEFSPNEKKQIIKIIEDNPLIIGEIINGSLPSIFLDELKKKKINLFPDNWEKLKRSCDCPDWGDPCKHMAGVYFILTGEIDKDPFLLFKLRGLDLIDIFKIRQHITAEYPIKIDYIQKSSNKPVKEIEIIKHDNFTQFILKKLQDNPPFMQQNFKKLLEKFYKKFKRELPTLIFTEKTEDFEKIENIFKTGKIEFIAEKDIISSHFLLTHKLISNENVKEILQNFGELKNKKIKFSPLTICKIFLNFNSFDSDNNVFSYLYFLSRIAYFLLDASALIPVVHENEKEFYCIFKLLISPLSVRKQLNLLNEITPVFVKFKKDKKYFNEETTNRFIFASIFTEVSNKIDFKLTTGTSFRFDLDIFNAIFKAVPFKTKNFETKGFAKSINNYFNVFYLLESNIKFSIFIENQEKDYLLKIKANDKDLHKIKDKDELIGVSRLLVNFTDIIPEIHQLIEHSYITLTEERLEEFILQQKNLILDLGIDLILPKELKELFKPEIKVSISSKNFNFQSFLSLSSLLEYDLKVAIGDRIINKEELLKLLKKGRELIRFKDKFVVLKHNEIKNLLKQFEKKKKISKYELLQLNFNDELILDNKLKEFLDNIFTIKDFPLPDINANLREYQVNGFNWGLNNLLNGFGIILADDMGLGKTIQTIAILKYLKENKYIKEPVLVVVPTTLLNNWENEILKFSPDFSYSFYYGQKREYKKTDIVFTSYQTLRRDISKLKDKKYSCVVIDEAQNIKNPNNQTTKAVKSLKSKFKIALSGTPVENNLSELWSIFDFSLPKYLKSLKDFQENFAKDIELTRDIVKIKKLKKITSPFMLRRLKTDKSIIKDLPEKIVIDQLISMEKEQAALYKAVVDKTLKDIEEGETTKRSGLIFKLLISLKQICNHPRNYDKKSPITKDNSGKTKTLTTLLDAILQRDEKVLIFTQYTEMGDILKPIIENEFLTDVLYLKGSQSKTTRDNLIKEFDENRNAKIFILSLKAGGTGLNLTKANNVIHYDLWFNPAVENQATDRVFRIGQTKNVNVYRFITKNSFEEKIDKMIKSKQALADMTISTGESWIGKLSNEELREVFA